MARFYKGVLAVMIVLGLTFGAGFSLNTVQAADTINLTFGGLWPPKHPITVASVEWIEKIEKESNGRVKIKPFLAGALYGPRESALELAKGVADIGDFSGAYAPMGYDFEKSMRMVFWGVNDRKLARKVYYEAMKKFPQLENEFEDAGIKVMAYASVPPYQLLMAKKKVTSAADFNGLTIKASGDLGKLATDLGGQGVVVSMGETYTALQKTTIDGAFAPFETMKSFRFAEVIDYGVQLDIAAAPAGHWGFCMKSWEKLPKDIQQVFLDNMEWFGERIEQLMYAGEDLGMEEAKKNNVEIITLPPAELQKIYTAAEKTILAQMAAVDAKGLPGTEVYKYMRSLIDQYSK